MERGARYKAVPASKLLGYFGRRHRAIIFGMNLHFSFFFFFYVSFCGLFFLFCLFFPCSYCMRFVCEDEFTFIVLSNGLRFGLNQDLMV